MTLEEVAFERLLGFLEERPRIQLIHAHPSSGKSHVGDLIQFSSPVQNRTGSRRNHVDFIACSETHLYLGELKGASSECKDDEIKLAALISMLGLGGIKSAIKRRLTRVVPELETAATLVPVIGCCVIDAPTTPGFLYLELGELATRVVGTIDLKALSDLSSA